MHLSTFIGRGEINWGWWFNKFHLLTGLGAQVGLHDVHLDYIHYLLLIGINKKSCFHKSGLKNTSAF